VTTPTPITRERVYRVLRQEIITGHIASGTPLVEEDIADRLDVSRTPVREALRRLEADCLVRRVRRGRLIATPVDSSELEELHLLRVAFDQVVAKLVCERTQPEDWDGVRALVVHLGEVVEGHGQGSIEFAMAHLDVHMAINSLAFNWRAAQYLNAQSALFFPMPTDQYVQQPGWDPGAQHRQLIDDLSSRDQERAVLAAVEHARRGRPALDGEAPVAGVVSRPGP
jgi:DNA-binding GntR family transcriptional regulator